jgi:peptidase E
MIGTIYLIGGGEVRNAETLEIDEDLKSLAPAGSTFVFLGFAAQDSSGYSDTIESVFGDKFEVLVPTEKKGRNYAIDALKVASIVYIGGGDTDLLMQLFTKWNLLEHLTAAHQRGVHIAGMSAGAQALSSWYVHEDNDIFEIRKGWGIVPVGVQVHTNQNSFSKTESLWATSTDARTYPFIAIGERAAWRIDSLQEQRQIGPGTIWGVANEEILDCSSSGEHDTIQSIK